MCIPLEFGMYACRKNTSDIDGHTQPTDARAVVWTRSIIKDRTVVYIKTSSVMSDIHNRDEPPNFLRLTRRNRVIRHLVVQSSPNGSK